MRVLGFFEAHSASRECGTARYHKDESPAVYFNIRWPVIDHLRHASSGREPVGAKAAISPRGRSSKP